MSLASEALGALRRIRARVFQSPTELLAERVSRLLTPYPEVVAVAKARSRDAELKARVSEYLSGDIPSYFGQEPVLYLARHVASPNFETLRWSNLIEPLELPAVIGTDADDLFVSQNVMKRALLKMPICLSVTVNGAGEPHEQYRYLTIADFEAADHARFRDIQTLWGDSVVAVYSELSRRFLPPHVRIEDDSAWVTRNGRGDLRAHYERFLSLFVAHGVLFEDYLVKDPDERDFIESVLLPAYEATTQRFGVRPLIASLTPSSLETEKFWLSYPRSVGLSVAQHMPGGHVSHL